MSTTNPQYIDGFVLPLPKAKLAEYQAIAEKAAAIWIEHGADGVCKPKVIADLFNQIFTRDPSQNTTPLRIFNFTLQAAKGVNPFADVLIRLGCAFCLFSGKLGFKLNNFRKNLDSLGFGIV